MPVVKRSVIVPYEHDQMFGLVNDVLKYPEFVPACVSSDLKEVGEDEVEACLDFAFSGFSKSFTTRNRLTKYERIDIELVDGPFKHLEGFWYFSEVGADQSKIELDLTFEFESSWMSLAFGPMFNQVANKLVDVFCERAVEVYGEKTTKNTDEQQA